MKALLRNDVYACQTADGAIFMDLKSGQYFGLDLQKTRMLVPHIQGWPGSAGTSNADAEPADEKASAAIVNSLLTGPMLLTNCTEAGKSIEFPVVRQTNAIPFRGTIRPYPRVNSRHILKFLRAYIRAVFEMECGSLVSTVRRVRARKGRHSSAVRPNTNIVELVRVFRFLTPWLYAAKDHCLFDSMVLVEFLASYSVFPTWVIGVRTRPFAAHSWLQMDSLVLNERLEIAELYVPIITV